MQVWTISPVGVQSPSTQTPKGEVLPFPCPGSCPFLAAPSLGSRSWAAARWTRLGEKGEKKIAPFSDSHCDHLNMSAGSNGKEGKKGLGRTQGSDWELGGMHTIPWVVAYADWRPIALFQKLNYFCTMFIRSWGVNTANFNSASPSRSDFWRL